VVISRILGIPHTAYRKGIDSKPSASVLPSPLEVSSLYVDDDIEASKSLKSACDRFDQKMAIAKANNLFIKQSSVKRGVSQVEFAGKHYDGRSNSISNLDRNVTKVLALAIRLISGPVSQHMNTAAVPQVTRHPALRLRIGYFMIFIHTIINHIKTLIKLGSYLII
jgi:hypothetical protein